MTNISQETQSENPVEKTERPGQAILVALAQHYPHLFGERLQPLKRGIFHDIVAAHPKNTAENPQVAGGVFAPEPAELKQALAVHTRSSRYLTAMASGAPRVDLAGNAVEPVTVEHRFDALARLLPRKKPRPGQPEPQLWFQRRVQMLFVDSNLDRAAFVAAIGGEAKLEGRGEAVAALVYAALDEAAVADARAEAIAASFVAAFPEKNLGADLSAATSADVRAFAAMYGLHPAAAQRQLQRAAQLQKQKQV